MRVLVTGLTGFVGSHLADLLAKKPGVRVHGLDCDIRNEAAVLRQVEKIRPERVFHLAGQASVASSWKAPEETLAINVLGQLNLFEALRKTGLRSRIQVAGSSDEYGPVGAKDIPIKESCALKPLSPYGVSKVAQDLLGRQYFDNFKIPAVRTRAFTHIGPHQREDFAASNFAKQVAMIEAGRQEPVLLTGDLEAVRDITDVRDVVRAYWLALEKGTPGEVYNISSGTGRRIGEIVEFYLGQSKVKIKVKKEASRLRPAGIAVSIGDSSKFRKKTGWRPEIAFETTLKDMLEQWRTKIGPKKARKKN